MDNQQPLPFCSILLDKLFETIIVNSVEKGVQQGLSQVKSEFAEAASSATIEKLQNHKRKRDELDTREKYIEEQETHSQVSKIEQDSKCSKCMEREERIKFAASFSLEMDDDEKTGVCVSDEDEVLFFNTP